jgi:hypothetical protein
MANKVKRKARRRILKGMIDYISLCPAGANEICTIYKSEDGEQEVHLSQLCKDMTEQGEIIAVVYAPEMVDDQGDVASAAVIKDFAHDFMRRGGQIDIKHNEIPMSKDDVFIAETTIVQKGDPRFANMTDYEGNSVDVTGGWGVVIKVLSESLRKDYRSGEWSGVSMGGGMYYEKAAAGESILQKIKDLINNKKENNTNTENDMPLTKEDEVKIGEIAGAVVAKAMEDAAKVAEKKAAEEAKIAKEKAEKEAAEAPKGLGYSEPILKSAPSDEDIMRFRKETAIYQLQKEVDPKDQLAVMDFQKAAKEIAQAEKLEDVLKKQSGAGYENFFVTNQESATVGKTSTAKGDYTDIGNGILETINKESETKVQV